LWGRFFNIGFNTHHLPNSRIPDCAVTGSGFFKAASQHVGGVNVLRADGGVSFLSNEMDLSLWQAFSTRAGGEPVSLP
jgi:prepilin-type processing-associated H-X9-DG protein